MSLPPPSTMLPQARPAPLSSSSSSPPPPPPRSPSRFETVITCNPPVLESLLCQVPTETVLRLYHTSAYLRRFLAQSPTAWKYLSFRLAQPATNPAAVTANGYGSGRLSGSYALDNLLINVLNAVSTRLTVLELDNTAVSGTTLVSSVLQLRRDTLQHLSVRGCKNVSLKYHINPWLQLHAQARQAPPGSGPADFGSLALKSLYTYRCRHHRRRPYLPASLVRKESDSEPTHELVCICHTLGIWTDTAWCTSPGARCYRRAMYVTTRMQQDSREVWVVFDRLWRSKNWMGPPDGAAAGAAGVAKPGPGGRRINDCKFWEADEHAVNGEALGSPPEGKEVPAHLRLSHRRFVDNIHCDSCAEPIHERCESCSVMMHCVGCRKTLCASCAFDRPYLRNKKAPAEHRNRFWWAPGCAVSPCSMLDQDLPPLGPANQPPAAAAAAATTHTPPMTKFKWCCTEPIFSGGGGITFSSGSSRDTDRIRAAPLPHGHGWEDADFVPGPSGRDERAEPVTSDQSSSSSSSNTEPEPEPDSSSLAGRWGSLEEFFEWQANAHAVAADGASVSVPRSLCDECFASDRWKVKCKGCSSPLCIKHDMRDRVKFRVCGAKDLVQERQEWKLRQKAVKALEAKKRLLPQAQPGRARAQTEPPTPAVGPPAAAAADSLPPVPAAAANDNHDNADAAPTAASTAALAVEADLQALLMTVRMNRQSFRRRGAAPAARPQSRGSNASDPASRSSSPGRDGCPLLPDADPAALDHATPPPPARDLWRGCQSVFCPPSRLPGDRRRRCAVPMRQCAQCKIHVCSDCHSTLEPSCPCKGCRVAPAEDGAAAATTTTTSSSSSTTTTTNNSNNNNQPSDSALFFCPNCRWERMVTGKCRRRTHAFLFALASEAKRKPRRRKERRLRKPLSERRRSDPGGGSSSSSTSAGSTSASEAIDGLADFFAALSHDATSSSTAESIDFPADLQLVDYNNAGMGDLREIRDVGLLARDLIRRIQTLRGQFRPGSAGALALPDIRLDDVAEVPAEEAPAEEVPAEEVPAEASGTTATPNADPAATAATTTQHHDSSATDEDEAPDDADG